MASQPRGPRRDALSQSSGSGRRLTLAVSALAVASVLAYMVLAPDAHDDVPTAVPATVSTTRVEPRLTADAPSAAAQRKTYAPPPSVDEAPREPRPACKSDADCRGPKLADCVRTSCIDGKCSSDRSSCECRTNAECDDGRECTRDLCFSSTHKCIHIDDACEP